MDGLSIQTYLQLQLAAVGIVFGSIVTIHYKLGKLESWVKQLDDRLSKLEIAFSDRLTQIIEFEIRKRK